MMATMTLKQRACEFIREQILVGGVQAGDQISDVTLSKRIGISRTPVREAMSQLESEGLLEQIPHVGVFVRKPGRQELAELYELREILEARAAERAASRLTQDQLDRLQVLCDDYGRIARTVRDTRTPGPDEDMARRMIMADLEFHLIIARGCGNSHLAKAISDSRMMTHLMGRRYLPSTIPFPDKMEATAREHQAVLDALRQRDVAKARELMIEHIRIAQRVMAKWYDEEEQRQGAQVQVYPSSIQALIGRMTR
jgi:DNA-binding GntR family transcriptional regulator